MSRILMFSFIALALAFAAMIAAPAEACPLSEHESFSLVTASWAYDSNASSTAPAEFDVIVERSERPAADELRTGIAKGGSVYDTRDRVGVGDQVADPLRR